MNSPNLGTRLTGVAAIIALLMAANTAFADPPIIAFTSATRIDEGNSVLVEIEVTDPDGDTPTWAWDTDDDGVLDEFPGTTSYLVPATTTDGPGRIRIGVRADDGVESRTVYRSINVDNVAPEITSFPLTTAAVRREYVYEITVDDPAGANDPIEYVIADGPEGMTVTDGRLTWTPAPSQRARSFPVVLRVLDGDGAEDTQGWTIDVANNTTPIAPSLVSPIDRVADVDGGSVTLVVENGADDDEDELLYFFRIARDSQFTSGSVIGSGEVAEGDGMTSWDVPETLEPGLWYWQAWVSDGITETRPRYAQLVVGSGVFEDDGTTSGGDAGFPSADGGMMPPSEDGRGGCSAAGTPMSSGFGWALFAVLGLSLRRRRGRGLTRRSLTGARRWLAVSLLVPFALGGCTRDPEPGDEDAGVLGNDEDSDGISNEDEGYVSTVDTDGDGVPDYLDSDSDNDGWPDIVEAGDTSLDTPPRDSDMDGTPDFRDTDSDGNGIPDGYETEGDVDMDGTLDFIDLDDDNDLSRDAMELGGVVNPPADSDGDGTPDYQDPDSDNDDILDGDEFGADTDADGLPDWVDNDSDNDGLSDAQEAGDTDLYSAPIDTDMDGIADFRDTDSDNDGLSDTYENENGTSPILADTDGDGVTDLIEVAAGTDPGDGTVSPRTRGDFVFVVPFEEPPSPTSDTLRFRTSLQLVDIYFLFDISGSMSGEIGALRSAVSTVIGDITCTDFGGVCESDGDCGAGEACSLSGTCIEDPTASACIANPWTGGGIYETQLDNKLNLQDDPSRTAAALMVATFGGTENLNRASWAIADPMGPPGVPVGCSARVPGFVGCPAYREDAVKILVAFTDEDSDGSERAADAAAALQSEDITFIGVWSGTPGAVARNSLVDLARLSDSLSGAGVPLVFDGQDAAVVPAVTDAINEVVRGVPIRVTIATADEPGDAGDALQFIDYLEVNTMSATCTDVSVTEDTDSDGRDDAFPSLLPGTPVCWDVVPRENTTVEPTAEPQVFRAKLTVSGDGSPLDSRLVYFLVPPVIPPPDLPI